MAGAAPDDSPEATQMSPDLVAPMVAFLAHEDCPVSGEIYAAGAGRFARIFIAQTEGYVHPTPAPTVEDVARALGGDQRRDGLLHPCRPHGLVGRLHGAPGLTRQELRFRSSRFRTFPEGFLGSASTSTTCFGTLNRASCRRQCSMSSSGVVVAGELNTT